MTEIVHEVAPGAQLYLICVNSEVTLGQAKDYVKANGIRIVNTSPRSSTRVAATAPEGRAR